MIHSEIQGLIHCPKILEFHRLTDFCETCVRPSESVEYDVFDFSAVAFFGSNEQFPFPRTKEFNNDNHQHFSHYENQIY